MASIEPVDNLCLNQFLVRQLTERDRTVWVYNYQLSSSIESSEAYSALGRMLWKIGNVSGVRLRNQIVTTAQIAEPNLQSADGCLSLDGQTVLDPAQALERKALEGLYRRSLRKTLRQISHTRLTSSAKGLIWWDERKVEQAGEGWQVLKGALLDVVVDEQGRLFLEIDTHYRFTSPWTLHQWLERYPSAPVNYVRNLGSDWSWYFVSVEDTPAEQIEIPNCGKTLAQYHRDKGVADEIIGTSAVVTVRSTKKIRGQQSVVHHLAKLLQPSVSMEVLSFVADQGDTGAKQVLQQVRKPIRERLAKGQALAAYLLERVYQQPNCAPQPHERSGFLFPKQQLFARDNRPVVRTEKALEIGCLRTGELKIGCLNLLSDEPIWPSAIHNQLLKTARASGVTLDLTGEYGADAFPDGGLKSRQFWTAISQEQEIKTLLVVCPRLGEQRKTQLRKEALRAGIAVQFMLPMTRPDKYRAANIILGLLVKAGWQPVGIQMPRHEKAAELAIGFDAGTNRNLFYGTSAFAVLADGQTLGWEIPEAQLGERLSGEAVWSATLSIIERFHALNNRSPRRIMLLRDGFVQTSEFDKTLEQLEQEGIEVDLLEVHKSGAGRMARRSEDNFCEVQPGTGFSINEHAFRIVTSKAHAGGSARPLEVVHVHGDAPLSLLASEIFTFSELHPASAFSTSRLPVQLHHADRFAKEVQRIGELGLLHNLDRRKLFAA